MNETNTSYLFVDLIVAHTNTFDDIYASCTASPTYRIQHDASSPGFIDINDYLVLFWYSDVCIYWTRINTRINNMYIMQV